MNAVMKKAIATVASSDPRANERGAALTLSLIILALLGVISMSVLALVSTEARIAGSDLCRTQTFYATAAGIEKMTNDFSALFARTSRPSAYQLYAISAAYPSELTGEGFSFTQSLQLDDAWLARMRSTQGITNGAFPSVTIPSGPFAGLIAAVAPYKLTSTATSSTCGGRDQQVKLEREINNYLIPLFQFGMFSDKDIELHPGPQFTFNGRVHANGNIYVGGNVKFLAKVTTANELVRDLLRNGNIKDDNNIVMKVGSIDVAITQGSVNNGPNLPGATAGQRGYFPGSPNGTANSSWSNSTLAAQSGVANRFGGQLQTRTTGGAPLLLPMQLDGHPTREIIKRQMPNDDVTLSQSRYHAKAQIRILLDTEGGAADASGIPAGQGQPLSSFTPTQLGGGKALWRMNDSGGFVDTSSTAVKQQQTSGSVLADTVRSPKTAASTSTSPGGVKIPGGAGLSGRILIQIVDSNGVARDVTSTILSMGMTEGEPNAIVQLQRPLWAAYTQGTRDATGGNDYLTYITNNTIIGADGEIKIATGSTPKPVMDSSWGYLTQLEEDTNPRAIVPPAITDSTNFWNSIVPINVYNVREGRVKTSLDGNTIYERGMTSVVEINMRNLARWVDGVYDTTLLSGTNAVSANINGSDGYIIYVSDRRGDRVKQERDPAGNLLMTTNGTVDNEDIYGPNGALDPGEDVIDAGVDMATGLNKKGTLQKDTAELPDPVAMNLSTPISCGSTDRTCRAKDMAAWQNTNIFRRALRLYNGEDLVLSGGANKLSSTKGITVATENMVYIWGNYNTTGINCQPSTGSTLNDPTQTCFYLGDQVPASIVADAFSPLSKVWFDATTSLYPDDLSKRQGDRGLTLTTPTLETSVRAGIIAGDSYSALAGAPDAGNGSESRLCGGMHNFPRFLEDWGGNRWNFVGSLVPLYHSTQVLGPYSTDASIYSPPIRNWAFDDTFRTPDRLPPGTPSFQYIEPTGFRQVVSGG